MHSRMQQKRRVNCTRLLSESVRHSLDAAEIPVATHTALIQHNAEFIPRFALLCLFVELNLPILFIRACAESDLGLTMGEWRV